jgi:hypothetical protein
MVEDVGIENPKLVICKVCESGLPEDNEAVVLVPFWVRTLDGVFQATPVPVFPASADKFAKFPDAPSGLPSLLKSAYSQMSTFPMPDSFAFCIPSPFASFQTRFPISMGGSWPNNSISPNPPPFEILVPSVFT